MPFSKRSDQTRTAILEAARERFAREGFDGTTIRAVAADAEIDPSMVMRYYGNKDGLFAAATDIQLRFPDLAGVPAAELGERLVRHFIELWEGDSSDELLRLLLRSSITNAAAAEQLRAAFGQQVVGALTQVMPDPEETIIRAGLISSQMLGLALTRYILKLPPVVALDAETLVATVGPTIQRYLDGPLTS